MVPKLWLDLLGKGGLSSEGLGEPGLGVAENWEGREEVDREGRKEAAGRGLGPDTYHGHTASLPPGCWGRSRARRQEVDTAKELRGSREETGAGTGRREREDTVRDGPRAEGDSGQKSPRPHPGPPSPTRCSDLGPAEAQLPGEALSRPGSNTSFSRTAKQLLPPKPGGLLTHHRSPHKPPAGSDLEVEPPLQETFSRDPLTLAAHPSPTWPGDSW